MAGSHQDYVDDVKKYVSEVHEDAVSGIVKHCGIAMQNRDSSLVAGTDPKELETVRESFLKRKLGLTAADKELDAAIAGVMHTLASVRDKSRVTVYYLLAEKFGKLDMFGGKAGTAHA